MKLNEQIESVACAHRARTSRGEVLAHPVWSDLRQEDRRKAYEAALISRRLEAALHPEGLSTTALSVLARIGHEE